jgi:hypothetical protein
MTYVIELSPWYFLDALVTCPLLGIVTHWPANRDLLLIDLDIKLLV